MSYRITNPEAFRQNLQKKLLDILHDDTMAMNMEKAIYNYAIREATQRKIVKKWENRSFAHIYIDRIRSIWNNLKNEGFLQKIVTKEITPHDAVFMTHQEMNETRWLDLIEKKKILDANRFNNNNTEASTTLFTCSRCKSNKCTFYSLQIRSCDEGETIFVSCTNCGKRWKKNS
jgi:DNA-directed RNA polymerase subunit M/transcription elongation factor TFIIS